MVGGEVGWQLGELLAGRCRDHHRRARTRHRVDLLHRVKLRDGDSSRAGLLHRPYFAAKGACARAADAHVDDFLACKANVVDLVFVTEYQSLQILNTRPDGSLDQSGDDLWWNTSALMQLGKSL